VVIELAVDHLLGGAHDGLAAARIEHPEREVHLGGGAFDDGERVDQRDRHALVADAQVAQRALGLRPPIAFGRHVDRAERVGLDARSAARFAHGRPRLRAKHACAR
jgi:hypothetical protein